jgi:iron(III) transport system permease protein
VYVDLFEPLGLVHRTLTLWLPLQDAVRVLPNLRSLPGAIIVIALVLYPYVYLSARTMFQFQSAEFAEAAKTLGAGAGPPSGASRCRWRVPRWRSAQHWCRWRR